MKTPIYLHKKGLKLLLIPIAAIAYAHRLSGQPRPQTATSTTAVAILPKPPRTDNPDGKTPSAPPPKPQVKSDKNGLKDVAKPHVGVYDCITAQFGDKDLLADFRYLRLELQAGGGFVLRYADKFGKSGKTEGEYAYDRARGKITFRHPKLQGVEQEFFLKNGEITLCFPVGNRQILLKFARK